jgi:hypothetical protein
VLEERVHALGPMRVVNVPIGHVHGFSFKPGTQGWVVTVAAEMLDEVLTPSEGLRRVLAHSTVVRGTPPMRMAMEQIFAEFAGRHFARAHILRALSGTLIGLVARELAEGAKVPSGKAKSDLFKRFKALLEQHFLQRWTVSQYAAALSVTPASQPPDAFCGRTFGVAFDPRPRHPRGATQSSLYQLADLDHRLCAGVQRPSIFQPDIFRGYRSVAARLPRQSTCGRLARLKSFRCRAVAPVRATPDSTATLARYSSLARDAHEWRRKILDPAARSRSSKRRLWIRQSSSPCR